MRAYLLSAPGRLSLETVPDPRCGPDEVTLRTEAVSICSTDISYFRGHLFPDAWPVVPAHEYVGRAVQVGADLRGVLREGDRVCYWGQTDFGGLADYRTIRPLFARPTAARETTWYTQRHFHDAHQAAAVVVPPELPGHLATLIEPLTSVLRSLLLNAPRPGDDCVLLGSGPSGILALQVMLRYFGVRSVTALDLDDARLNRATAAGATSVLNPGRQTPQIEALIADHRDQYADYVFDALPHLDAHDGPDSRELAMGLLRPGGDYVVYGATGLPQSISTWMILAKGLRLRGTPFDVRAFPMGRSAHVARIALSLITRGVVDADAVVTSRLAFDDEDGVRNAFEHYGTDGGMKPSITTGALPGSPAERPLSGETDGTVRQPSGSLR
ncbi:zinc-binding dehydrogenase [Streptomyces sp. NPDC000594]|uniref:zinc-dependent alcohol dehydrogenase n=1 Tax=Streptomyces sp. NPDC000594 TaxID=3154261 RepID=UPI00331BD865